MIVIKDKIAYVTLNAGLKLVETEGFNLIIMTIRVHGEKIVHTYLDLLKCRRKVLGYFFSSSKKLKKNALRHFIYLV